MTAKRATTGWPVEIPPSIPPAWFDKKKRRAVLAAAYLVGVGFAGKSGGGKTVADLDALDRVDRHKGARQFRVELAIDWRAPARRHIFGHDLDDGADGGPCLADGIEIGLEKRRRLGVGAEEGIFGALVPIPIGAIDFVRTHLHERAADQHLLDDFSRDRARRHAHGGFPRGRTAAAAMVPDSIFAIIGKIGVARPVGVLDRVVVF